MRDLEKEERVIKFKKIAAYDFINQLIRIHDWDLISDDEFIEIVYKLFWNHKMVKWEEISVLCDYKNKYYYEEMESGTGRRDRD